MNKFEKKEITKKNINFSRWYNDIVLKAGLADYSPVKGCMVIKPYGYALWERMQNVLDKEIKMAGVENAYFPLFIPASFLQKEKDHIKGFSPELAIVTIAGGKELKEKLVVRPTSETIIYSMFSKWIKSWRDLPLKINQWCNVVRWEKRTYLFLRTTEFLWQEGHTCHISHKEARQEVKRALKMYAEFYQKWLAMPGIIGKKSQFDKFPGAIDTFSYEMLMPDGKVLQGCTSHDLGQNFSKPFKIQFQGEKSKRQYVWQTCWGFSTRTIGALIMMHGDDNGLVLPPKIAPIQIIIIPISSSDSAQKTAMAETCAKIKNKLEKIHLRVKIDDREGYTPGYKFNDWELKGVPIRIEIGEREIRENKVTLVRRDTNENFQFSVIPAKDRTNNFQFKTKEMLDKIQNNLFIKAKKFLEKNTHEVNNWPEFQRIMKTKKGFIKAFWCGNKECEQKIKAETKAASRGMALTAVKRQGKCIYCGKKAFYQWFFAQSY